MNQNPKTIKNILFQILVFKESKIEDNEDDVSMKLLTVNSGKLTILQKIFYAMVNLINQNRF